MCCSCDLAKSLPFTTTAGALLDELGQQALAEQHHEPNRVPLRQRVPGAVSRPAGVGGDQVQVGVPLQERAASIRTASAEETTSICSGSVGAIGMGVPAR
jgi:hypothetical protein